MTKTLKKVVSLVASLAMVATTAVVASAQPTVPSDVVGTSSEQAVKELVALNIVNGYEDGTYKPDNNITRAEVTKLIVAAMGPTYLQNAEAASGKDTQFTDVKADNWAAGYIATGVANSFINGMGDGTFAPDENVTYAQVVKMIIASMGYTSICEKNGGYPNGYLSVAASQGVTAGVTGVSSDEAVNRGQVAILLDNAIKTPIVSVTGYEESSYTGQLVAKTEIMDTIDGTDAEDYQTLLTQNHDAYVVKGRIEDTTRSDSDLDEGTVRFSVEATKNFDDIAYGTSYADPTVEDMYYDGTDADALMFQYAEAIVSKDDNDEYTILCITTSGKNDTTELSASLYDAGSYTGTSLDMYTSESSSKTKTYKLEDDVKVYVNGVDTDDKYSVKDALEKFVENNNNGVVTLIDATDVAKTTTNGKIDYILVTYYEDAVVDSTQTNSSNYKVYWKEAAADVKTLTIDPDDDDVTVTFTKGDEAIAYTDLAEYDVASIAYDVTGDFKDSSFYDVKVSDTKVTGQVSAAAQNNNDTYYYTIGGTDYEASYSRYGQDKGYDKGTVLEVGTDYVVYLNAFGNIAYFDEDSTTKTIGVIDYASVDSGDTPKIRIITSAGTKVSYTVKDNSKTTFEKIASDFFSVVKKTAGTACSGKNDLSKMIAEYTINSAGYITAATPLYKKSGETVNTFTKAEYKANTNKVGSYSLASTTTIIDLSDGSNDIDEQDFSKVSAVTTADLEDGADYDGVVASKSSSDSTYRFVVITKAGNVYTANSPVCVFQKKASAYDDTQGTSIDTLMVYGADSDELATLKVDSTVEYSYETVVAGSKRGADNATDYAQDPDKKPNLDKLLRGDMFVYNTDSDGYVTEVKVLFSLNGYSYKDLKANFIGRYEDATKEVKDPYTKVNFTDDTDNNELFISCLHPVAEFLKTTSSTKSGKVGMVAGPIMDKSGNNVTIAKPGQKGIIDMNDGVVDVSVASGANIYVYDYTETKADNRLYKGTQGNITKTNVPSTYKTNDNNTYDISEDDVITNFIVAKTVDDDMTDILVIIGSDD